jgi:hypothetical protein
MRHLLSLRRVAVALLLLVAFLSQGTWALAGTTGGLSGTVTDDKGAPVAGAAVKAVSPSETVSQTTDASGHFGFLSLAPDTYTVSITKDGFNPNSYTGVTVFADQALTLSFRLTPSLKVIANTTSKTSASLVSSSRTSDVYAVTAAQQNAVKGLGGGYNLDSAYAGIYSQPGVQGQVGVYGFGQVFYIRGSAYSQVGYEFDGVPVNRAFDNYNANSLSDTGTQQTEVYTGGSPAGATSPTLAGYINQVIKTGTYPGTATAVGGIGSPNFYHKLDFEGGGATPDRLFSWYAGIRGVNSSYPFINNQNGGNLSADGSNQYGISGISTSPLAILLLPAYNNGPWSTCSNTGAPAAGSQTIFGIPTCQSYSPVGSGQLSFPSYTADRENVFNFHFGIPHHHDGGKDDVQLLYDNFAYLSTYADTINASGGLANINKAYYGWGGPTGYGAQFGLGPYPGEGGPYSDLCAFNAFFGGCATSGPSTVPYLDKQIFAPGTAFGQNASTANAVTYFAPNTGTNRAVGQGINPNDGGGIWNNGSIIKLQYQKNIGSSAFVRLMGYTFYSSWLQNNPASPAAFGLGAYGYFGTGAGYPTFDYELSTHTRGIQLDAEDQVNAQNLLSLTGNYTTASVTRWNNQFYSAPSHPTNLTDANGNCYSVATGSLGSCLSSSTGGTYDFPTGGWATNNACANTPAGSAACAAGAAFTVTVPGGYGTLNQVVPKFTSLALTDEIRPNDKIDLNVGLRYENYTYDFPSTVNSEFNFWFRTAQNSYCYDPATGQPVLNPVTPTSNASLVTPVIAPNLFAGQNPALCYAGNTLNPLVANSGRQAVHPNGLDGNTLYTNVGVSSISHPLWSPRIGGTYTFDPDTVLRVNYGRYTQPTETAFEQYENASGRGAATFDFTHFFGLGFNTPVHNNPVQVSNNYDLSVEHHFTNTDWSAKLSPFYRYTTNQIVTVSLGGNFASGINAGTQKTTGVELAIQKGDPSRNGLSGQLSYTYTYGVIRYSNLSNGSNTISTLNNFIRSYNGLTSFCATHAGSSQCPTGALADAFPYYCAGVPTGPNATNQGVATVAACTLLGGHAIQNAYYNLPAQGFLDPNGYYPAYANNPPYTAPDGVAGTALSPNQFTGFVQYKHDRWTATVQGVLQQGNSYGSPTAVIGLDPRSCGANQVGIAGVGTGLQLYPNYQTCGSSAFTSSGSLAIPNPVTGRFDTLSQYRNPWVFNMGLQFGYDVSSTIHAQLTLANVVNTCFGGTSTSWSSAYPANGYVCGWAPNGFSYIGSQPGAGFFYGTSGRDAANGTAPYPNWMNQPYSPLTGALPFQAYLNVSVKL